MTWDYSCSKQKHQPVKSLISLYSNESNNPECVRNIKIFFYPCNPNSMLTFNFNILDFSTREIKLRIAMVKEAFHYISYYFAPVFRLFLYLIVLLILPYLRGLY